MLTASGCAADRALRVRVPEGVVRPSRSAVLFFVDGLGREQFDEALSEGRLPNIRHHLLERGVLVQAAVASIPTITYANAVTFLTGLHPGHHGIVSNKWYDPRTGQYQNYGTIATFQLVDGEYSQAPTIHEVLAPRVGVSVQAAQRRGAVHTIDNWATSGINWFFGNYSGVDCLVAQGFELIGQRSAWWGRWPDYILAYFPGVDHMGHDHGWRSAEYRRALDNVDAQIGRICDGLRQAGMYNRTILCLASDHGVVQTDPRRYFDLADHLERACGARVWRDATAPPIPGRLAERGYTHAYCCSGSRWASVHRLAAPTDTEAAFTNACRAVLQRVAELGSDDSIDLDEIVRALPGWLADGLAHPAVELAAMPIRADRVALLHRDRIAFVLRDRVNGAERHRVVQSSARPIIDPASIPHDVPADAVTDDRAWLAASVRSRYPDLVPQIACLFDSPRAGDVAFFAAEGWDFSPNDPRGGHGSILPQDMCVPMVFAGPGLRNAAPIPVARNCDVMPTILHLLDAPPIGPDGRMLVLDGVSLFDSPAANEAGISPARRQARSHASRECVYGIRNASVCDRGFSNPR